MKKIISTRDFADIKRMAQIVNPKVSRKTTLLKQKAKIDAEIAELDQAISLLEGGIKCRFLGLGTEQLVKKTISPAVKEDGTPYLDAKTGKQLTKTTWEPCGCLVYNKDKNNYTLTVDDVPCCTNVSDVESVESVESTSDEAQVAPVEEKSEFNPFDM